MRVVLDVEFPQVGPLRKASDYIDEDGEVKRFLGTTPEGWVCAQRQREGIEGAGVSS